MNMFLLRTVTSTARYGPHDEVLGYGEFEFIQGFFSHQLRERYLYDYLTPDGETEYNLKSVDVAFGFANFHTPWTEVHILTTLDVEMGEYMTWVPTSLYYGPKAPSLPISNADQHFQNGLSDDQEWDPFKED